MTERPDGLNKRAIYVDALGREREARTFSKPDSEGRTAILVGGGGITVHRARYSDGGEPGTWHWPPRPN